MYPIHENWVLVAALISVVSASPEDAPENFFAEVNLRRVQSVLALDNLLTVYANSHHVRSSETSCREEMLQYTKAISSGRKWAMHMLDASSKIPSGLLMGNLLDLGMYDQCVVVHPRENLTNIQGRHCMYTLNLPSTTLSLNDLEMHPDDSPSNVHRSSSMIELTLSVCLPSSCGADDVQQIMDDAIGQLPILVNGGIRVGSVTCSRVEAGTWGLGEIATIILLLSVVLFMVVCTLCEFVKDHSECRKSKALETLSKFSLYTNAKSLLRTKTSPERFPFIDGIRCLSMFWIVLGHQYLISWLVRPVVNRVEYMKWLDWPWSMIFTEVLFSVDTFLVINGFLLAHKFMKIMKQGATFNLSMYYIHRYIRLTPCVAVMILITLYIVDRLGSGPQWDLMIGDCTRSCKDNWWHNLLYVQNFNALGMCVPQTWYLAVVMQLFWLSPIILYPLHHWPRVGLTFLALCFAASVIIPTGIGILNGYSASFLRQDKSFQENFVEVQSKYLLPHMRSSPWFIGVYLGYIIVVEEKCMSKLKLGVGWILCTCAFVFCLVTYRPILFEKYEYDVAWEVVSISMTRPLWGAGIAWIIYVCKHGYGGPVEKFLSLPFFAPLGRLSFCIYLVHYIMQFMRSASMRTSIYMSHFELVVLSCTDLVVSTVIAFFFSLFIEIPFGVLEKMLNGGRSPFEHSKNNMKVK